MEIKRVFDLLYHQKQRYNLSDALNFKKNGDWYCYSTQDFIDIVNRMSVGLLKLGLKKGDKVALISNNRPEWNFIDFGAQQIGVITVPMYPTISEEDYHYIFNHSEVQYAFVGDQEIFEKTQSAAEGTKIKEIYSFDELENCKHWHEVEDLSEGEDLDQLEEHKKSVTPEDLLSIVYTSGTTGRPKGVMLSHSNLVFNTVKSSMRIPKELKWGKSRVLSFLPLCHIAERGLIFLDIYIGASIYYAESIEKVADNIKEVKPNYFFSVPRLLEKVYDKIMAKGQDLPPLQRDLFMWAVDLGLKYDPNRNQGLVYNLQREAANYLIFSKWREALGGELQFILSGAAPLQPKLAKIFWAANIKVVEAYGLTETSPIIAASIPTHKGIRIGCVGAIQDGVEVQIAADGEVLCKGGNVMQGYYKDPEKTAEVLHDGWFHTGDIGEIIEGKYLKITDRKKEMFKTSGGKYIAPGYMENVFKQSLFIEQMAVVGANHKFPAALIVPNFEAVEDWCKQEGIKYTSKEEMIHDPRIIEKFEQELAEYNSQFGKWEQLKKFVLLAQDWSVESGELTPTLKLKRRVIDKKYRDKIEGIYEELAVNG
ncbi:MAG: AMP-dependent synthetase/ligase [Flammeovirgaceae bacterium]